MSVTVQAVTPTFAVAAQLSPADVASVVAQGFKTLINNRPDGEGGSTQPLNGDIEAAAKAAGLNYVYLPVISGAMTAEQVQAMREVVAGAVPPVLAFCRSGARSTQLFNFAQSGG